MVTEIIVVKDKPNNWLQKSINKFRSFLIKSTGEGMIEILQEVSPKDTGKLSRSWFIVREDDDEAIIQSREKYAVFVDEGTGLFGERHTYITPKNSDYMSFEIKGEGTIFAKKVIGQPPQQYLRKATTRAKNKLKRFEEIAINHVE